MFSELDSCTICPRDCGVDRNKGLKGYCGFDAGYHVASVVLHRGEEPVVNGAKGICNVFFRGCNLRCNFCQNYQISRKNRESQARSLDDITRQIIECLRQGAEAVGFVSPTHFVPHVKAIISNLRRLGYNPVTVYNTNAYDKEETLRYLEGWIDVYLPDFKYFNSDTSLKYSAAYDYPSIAMQALKEMYRQKGSTVVLNENGQAVTGLIIRHLVLPGHSADSIAILQWIAEELTEGMHISLMSQYYPTQEVITDPLLGRYITHEEYQDVIDALERLGFYRGWIQDFDSHLNYRPDFRCPHPFER